MTSLDLRGRDLVIIPPGELLHLPTPELLKTLFGTSLPAPLLATMRRDKRYHFLRTQPIHFAGGEQEMKPITIITYDSAALYPRELRRFGLLIFDECHHLPAPTYRFIAESAFTPLRLGLSATPERSDMAHVDLDMLIGPEVYRRLPAELTEGHYLAQYQEVRSDIALSSEDEARYNEQRRVYRSFLHRRRIVIHSPEEFQQKIIFLSARDPEARKAMLAWREARNIAMNAPAKYAAIDRPFDLHAHY